MATLKSVIDMVDEIKPNAFSNEAKTQWQIGRAHV